MAGMATDADVTLFLVRHGQTVWHAENRYAGSSDIALTDAGRAQAEALAAWASTAQLTAIAVSDLSRSRQTAAPVAAATSLAPVVRPGLREQHFGVAEGRTLAEVEQQDPSAARAFREDPWGSPFPGAEQPAAAAERFLAALDLVAADAAAATTGAPRVLVVCHNTVLRLALCRLLGVPGSGYRRLLAAPDNGAYTELRWAAGPARPAAHTGQAGERETAREPETGTDQGRRSATLVRYNVPLDGAGHAARRPVSRR